MAQAPIGHVYRMNWWFRAFALLLLAFGTFICTVTALNIYSSSGDSDFTKLALVLVFPAVGAIMTAKSFSSTLSFTESFVERRSLLGFESVSLAAVRGRREYVVRGTTTGGATRYLRLVATDNECLDFGKSLYAFDEAFWDWFYQLPDLDVEEAKSSRHH